MIRIHSKNDTSALLHIIWRSSEGDKGKMNFLTPEDQCLQGAAGVSLPKDYTFGGPHKHLPQERTTNKTQESFVVIRGSIEVEMYDTDNSFIGREILNAGDCYIYLGGGHSFKILTENSLFYEIKNGPYFGREKDKTFIK